jgi:hypothetical protein
MEEVDAIPELAQNEWRGAGIRQDSAHTATVVLPVENHWQAPLLETRTA